PKESQQKISIGWIIVGYPRNFDFDNTDVILKSDKYLVSENGTHFVAKDLGYEDKERSTGCILCTCVIEAPEKTESQYNPYKSPLIFGTHFDTNDNSACIFTNEVENNVVPRLKLFSSRGNSGQINIKWSQINIKWKDAFTFLSGRNCSNVQLYHGTLNVDVGSKKATNGKEKHSKNSETPILLVNQLVDDCSTNVHGFLNVKDVKVDNVDIDSVGVIYGSLNSRLSKEDGKIAYLVVHKT
ncbi:2951_t:CDS:2, partial [Racocetra fulgida]